MELMNSAFRHSFKFGDSVEWIYEVNLPYFDIDQFWGSMKRETVGTALTLYASHEDNHQHLVGRTGSCLNSVVQAVRTIRDLFVSNQSWAYNNLPNVIRREIVLTVIERSSEPIVEAMAAYWFDTMEALLQGRHEAGDEFWLDFFSAYWSKQKKKLGEQAAGDEVGGNAEIEQITRMIGKLKNLTLTGHPLTQAIYDKMLWLKTVSNSLWLPFMVSGLALDFPTPLDESAVYACKDEFVNPFKRFHIIIGAIANLDKRRPVKDFEPLQKLTRLLVTPDTDMQEIYHYSQTFLKSLTSLESGYWTRLGTSTGWSLLELLYETLPKHKSPYMHAMEGSTSLLEPPQVGSIDTLDKLLKFHFPIVGATIEGKYVLIVNEMVPKVPLEAWLSHYNYTRIKDIMITKILDKPDASIEDEFRKSQFANAGVSTETFRREVERANMLAGTFTLTSELESALGETRVETGMAEFASGW
ncbi:MAG: hypothetical protein HY296_06080 [Thaumarchaeota archaeon]|nr:hypothetical protein [Nitrososphaerota archaeon]